MDSQMYFFAPQVNASVRSETKSLSYSWNVDPDIGNGYSFNSANGQLRKNEEIPLIPATIGPDPRNAKAILHISPCPSVDAGNGVFIDFNFGFRVKMPDTNKVYHLRVFDADTQTSIADMTVSGGSVAVGDKKYFIRCHIEVIDTETNQLVAVHDYDCENKRVMIIIPDGGLGDNFAWMPYADEFRKKHHAKVTCVCGEWLSRIVREQYPELEFASVSNVPDSKDFYASYFCAIFPFERKSWRPTDHQNLGMQGAIARLLGVDAVPCKIRLPYYEERPVQEPYVCISTLATNPGKFWNYPDGWNILIRYLKRLGYRVFDIDRNHELVFNETVYSIPSESEDCTGLKPITERIAMLQHAEFFVGLPSGLSWVAWNCNIPVVMISGFTLDGSEFPTPYRVFNQNFCHGCWNDSNLFFDANVPVWCPRHVGTPREIECTRVITPKMVIEAVNRIPTVRERIETRNSSIRLSVIIPVTRGAYIAQCVHSVVQAFASYGHTEILLYNDASPEPNLDMQLQRLRAENPDIIHVFRGSANLGAALARQEMVKLAKGDYVVIFDDDDIMLPFDVKKVVDFMDTHSQYCASYAPKYLFNKDGYMNEIHGSEYSYLMAFFAPKVNINAAFIRKTDLLEAGGFIPVNGDKKALSEDTYLLIRMSQKKDIWFDSEARTLYRIHDTQLTHTPIPWNNWITQQPYEQHPELVQRILAGDIPDPCGPDFRVVRGLMGAILYFHQNEPKITEPIIQAAMKYFPEDPGVPDARLRLFRMQNRLDELLEYYPKALERFKDSILPRINILSQVLSAMQEAKMQLPQNLVQLHTELHSQYYRLSPVAEACLAGVLNEKQI